MVSLASLSKNRVLNFSIYDEGVDLLLAISNYFGSFLIIFTVLSSTFHGNKFKSNMLHLILLNNHPIIMQAHSLLTLSTRTSVMINVIAEQKTVKARSTCFYQLASCGH